MVIFTKFHTAQIPVDFPCGINQRANTFKLGA